MKKNILLVISFITVLTASAQDSVSVLFIGNSYTYVNNMPLMVEDLATSLGDVVNQSSQTAGGATFQTHVNNAATYTSINSEQWDFVVLQAQSQEPSFPENQVNTETLPYGMQIADSAYANKFCTDVMMFMTWGRENGDPQWGPISTFEGMNNRLRAAYIRMADSVQGSVAAVGSAWRYVRDMYPTINLYNADESHPSVEGSYLAACTFYASLFRKSPVGASYISTLDAVTAGTLQSAAAITVLDSLDFWNLRPINEHTQAEFIYTVNGNTVDFTNSSTKALTYTWDFGDLNSSNVENPTHVYATSGLYTVQLIASSPCDSDTIEYQISVGNIGLLDQVDHELELKTLGSGRYELSMEESPQQISIIDFSGKVICEYEYPSKTTKIDISSFSKGVYIMWIEFENGASIKIRLIH